MAYNKLNLKNGDTFDGYHVKHIEDGIYNNDKAIDEIKENVLGITTNLNRVRETVSNNSSNIDNVSNIVADMTDQLNSVDSVASQLQKDASDLDARVTSLEEGNIDVDHSHLQEKLVSGQNIKTINGQSILGEGNLYIEGGSSSNGSNIVHLNGDEICDYYAINSSGNHVLATGYGSSWYIDCFGCSSMEITVIQTTSNTGYGLAFYDANKSFISFVPTKVGSTKAVVKQNISIPSNAYYFRTTFFNYEQQKTYGEFECTLVFSNNTIIDGKRPYQDGYIYFSQRVNQSLYKYWETDIAPTNDVVYKATTGVLALPKSYKQTGRKTPLILYSHGLSQYVYYGAWTSSKADLASVLGTQKQTWLDMGFAVMDCNGARDNNRQDNFASGICPQGVNAFKQCVDYITEHYNIDPEIFVVGSSAGGAIAWNYLNMYGRSVKAAAFLSAWSNFSQDGWNGASTIRPLYVEYLGFNNTSTYEADKAIGFDQGARIVSINSKNYCFNPANIPLYAVWGSTENAGYITSLKNMFTALRNAGMTAQIRCVNGVGHEISYGGVTTSDIEVGNWFKSYLYYSEEKVELEYCIITYKYVDTDGNTVQSNTTERILKGTSKTFGSVFVDGYTFVSVSVSSATVNSDMTVTYTFEKNVEPEEPVKEDITDLFVFTNGGAIETHTGSGKQGTVFTTALFKYSDYVDVSEMPNFEMSFVKWKSGGGAQATLGYALYDENKTFISGTRYPFDSSAANSSGTPYMITVNITNPNVKYIRTGYPADSSKYGEFKAYKLVDNVVE